MSQAILKSIFMKQKLYKIKKQLSYSNNIDFETGQFFSPELIPISEGSIILFLEIKEFRRNEFSKHKKIILKILYNGQSVHIPFGVSFYMFENTLKKEYFEEIL